MNGKLTMTMSLLALASLAWAHGEDKPGPHGGHVRMPGAFHTEVVSSAKGDTLKVYLLDMAFTNPTVAGSQVEATVKGATAKKTALRCEPEADHFVCQLPKNTPQKAQLELSAVRAGQKGGTVSYSLPLAPKV